MIYKHLRFIDDRRPVCVDLKRFESFEGMIFAPDLGEDEDLCQECARALAASNDCTGPDCVGIHWDLNNAKHVVPNHDEDCDCKPRIKYTMHQAGCLHKEYVHQSIG